MLAVDLTVAAAHHRLQPARELDRTLDLAPSTPASAGTAGGASARMGAVNAQNRWAPSARLAVSRIPSATSTYRSIVAISQAGRSVPSVSVA
jgi:hypothetical protein